MLAALLLNLGGGGPPQSPPTPTVVAGFGGGPFWRRYGYDKAFDPYRRTRDEEDEPVIQPEPVMVKLVVPNRSVYNPTRRVVSEEVVRRLEEQFVRAKQDEEDELMTIFALLS